MYDSNPIDKETHPDVWMEYETVRKLCNKELQKFEAALMQWNILGLVGSAIGGLVWFIKGRPLEAKHRAQLAAVARRVNS